MRRLPFSGAFLLAGVLLAAAARAGDAMTGETHWLPRSAVTAGGGEAASASYRMIFVAGEELASSTAPVSAGSRLGAGLSQTLHFPGAVADLAASGVTVSSVSLDWSGPGADGVEGSLQAGTTYFVRVASYTVPDTFNDHRFAGISFSTSGTLPGAAVSTGAAGLLPNTTYWARLWTMDPAGNLSYASNVSTFVTLALPVAVPAEPFLEVSFTSVTAWWHARPLSPPAASSMTAAGYRLEASSTNFGALEPGGVVSSSETSAVLLSTLTVSDPGLVVARTYHFRVGALNWAGVPNWTALGSTDTKFQVNDPLPADPPFTDVSTGSLTVNWDRNGNPANALYHAEVSADPAFSVVTATETYNLFYSTGGLALNATYYFRVHATTRSVSSAVVPLGSTATWAMPPAPAAAPFAGVHESSFTVLWSANGNPPDVSTYSVIVTTDSSFPNAHAGNAVLVATRPAGGSPAASFAGLARDERYYVFADARNWSGASSGFTLIASTATRPAPPSSLAFAETAHSSASVSWSVSGNPLGVTSYTVTLSTVSSFPPGGEWDVSIATVPDAAAPVLALEGLRLNATYWLFVEAVGKEHEARTPGASTATKAAVPGASPDLPAHEPVATTGFTLNWSSGTEAPGYNAAAPRTTYYALVSANPGFSPVLASSATLNLSADFSGLAINTTYYARVSAFSHHSGTWTAALDLPSTATLAALPAAGAPTFRHVHFTSATVSWSRNGSPIGVTSYTVVLSSGAAYPEGLSDDVALDTAPAGGTPTATLDGLSSGVTYFLYVRALNHQGAGTAYAALGSTRTLVSPKTWTGAAGNALWHTATNWSPTGVPGPTDAVTIALAASVVASAASPAISFSSLTLGSPAGAAANLHLATGIARGGDVLIRTGAGLTQASTQELRLTGDWTMLSGSSLAHAAHSSATLTSSVRVLVAGTFDLRAGATIAASALGYAGGAANGGNGFGPGPGLGNSASSGGGSGAGHGGTGGAGAGGAAGGPYDSLTDPVDAGSGGGGGDFASATNTGGAGGGVVRLRAGTLLLDGLIEASGGAGGPGQAAQTARGAGGGGSGGAVNLTADEFSGSGEIRALGGGGGTDTDNANDPGGGGAGGRVALEILVSGAACGVSVSTAGGASGGGTAGDGEGGTYSSTSTLLAPSGFAAAAVSSHSVTWTWGLSPAGASYQVFDALDAPVSSLLGAAATQFEEPGLLPNTTYTRYVRVTACGAGTSSAQALAATLTSTPTVVAAPFLQMWTASATVAWAASVPGGSQGYVLEASSTNFGALSPGGVTHSSETFARTASTLTAASPALEANTTYYFRVAGLNWAGAAGPYAAIGATSTLALPIETLAPSFLLVEDSTAAVRWAARPASPPEASCEGYVLEASTTNFGVETPGGAVLSSATASVLASTLTFSGLDLSSRWYFRVGTLNRSGAANFTSLEPLFLGLSPSTLYLNLGGIDGSSPFVVAPSSWEVTNVGTLPVTIRLRASTQTAGGSPWSLGTARDLEGPVLQGLWNGAAPAPEAFAHAITPSTAASGGGGGDFAGDQDGAAVAVGDARGLWLKLWLPLSTVVRGTERIEVTATPRYP